MQLRNKKLKIIIQIFVTEQDGKPMRSEDRKNNDLIVDVEYRF